MSDNDHVGAAHVPRPGEVVELEASDAQVGAVEIKNGADDTRVVVAATTPAAGAAGLVVREPPVATGGQGSKAVAAAATPERLAAASTPCSLVIMTARPGNTGIIAYGFANTVRATAGSEVGALLDAGGSVALPVSDVTSVFIDASVSGEGVSFTYLTA